MPNESAQTLGQRIDAVLEPLYAEAEQHRATIAAVTQQQQALQAQIDSATQGLAQIESRMVEVVRSLAEREPIIAAVVGQNAATDGCTVSTSQPYVAAESVIEPKPIEAVPSLTVEDLLLEPEASSIELDPKADAQAVGEAAALLDALPDEPAPLPKPEIDLAAAAERAAAAAKQLRDKAAAK